MKRLIMILSVVLLGMTAKSTSAQSKIGYVDSQKIMQSLKETQAVQAKLQVEQEKMAKQFQYLQDSLANAQDDFVNNYKNNPLIKENIRQSIQKGIEELAYYVQTAGQRYNEELGKKQQELMQPIFDKVKKALENVRKAEGMDFILDSASGILLAEDTKYDLTEKAINELIKMAGTTTKDTGVKETKDTGKK
ncbi:OmpH family outer membrane protein [bacterium]|nr:MAG: OmpH family outer membrane protein [bacterium]